MLRPTFAWVEPPLLEDALTRQGPIQDDPQPSGAPAMTMPLGTRTLTSVDKYAVTSTLVPRCHRRRAATAQGGLKIPPTDCFAHLYREPHGRHGSADWDGPLPQGYGGER